MVMTRISALLLAAGLIVAGCSKDTTPVTPSPNTQATFTATLLPANEVPPVANAENTGSGTVTITLNVPFDVAQNLLNNPGAYYFNVHTTVNGGGVARGQLTKQ